jgi:transposase
MGLNHFYTDSDGNTVENPRHLPKAQKRLKGAQRFQKGFGFHKSRLEEWLNITFQSWQ